MVQERGNLAHFAGEVFFEGFSVFSNTGPKGFYILLGCSLGVFNGL